MMSKIITILLWIFLNAGIVFFMDLALFSQLKTSADSSFAKKLLVVELFATIEWMFAIPALKLGNQFLTAAQVLLSTFIFNFIGQIITNEYWLNIPTTLDDYVAMFIIIIATMCSICKFIG